jgi:hypothetical protein
MEALFYLTYSNTYKAEQYYFKMFHALLLQANLSPLLFEFL